MTTIPLFFASAHRQRTSTGRSLLWRFARQIVPALLLMLTGVAHANIIHVFLLGGQSNMDGRADTSGLPAGLQSPQANVPYYYSTSTGLTTDRPGTSATGQFGPEVTFGQSMASFYGSTAQTPTVALLKYSVGATSLATDWKAGGDSSTNNDGAVYKDFQSTIWAGLNALQNANPNATFVFSGMIWMQGENDAAASNTSTVYQTNLTNFVADIRATFNPSLPFVIGRLSANQTGTGDMTDRENVRTAQTNVAANLSRMGLVNTDSFTFTPSGTANLHFDAAGQQALGNGFASSMQSLLSYTLSASASNGSINRNPSQQTYADGTQVSLTAVPATNYKFDSWSGDASGSNNPLTITVDGNKNVSANFSLITYTLGTSAVNGTIGVNPVQANYVIGTQVTLTATADLGYRFVGWSGSAGGTGNPLQVTMDGNKTISAMFAAIPSAAASKGTYYALVSGEASGVWGTATLSISATRTFSASIRLNGHAYALRGAFDANGEFSGTIPRTNYQVAFIISATGGEVTGTLADGGNVIANFGITRSLAGSQGDLASMTGRYTFIVKAKSANDGSPQGNGYGMVLIGRTGNIVAVGRLSDGTPFARGAVLTQDKTWIVYLPLYRNAGLLSGIVTFEDNASSDLDGTLDWSKPSAFSTQVAVLGSTFVRDNAIGSTFLNSSIALGIPQAFGGTLDKLTGTAILSTSVADASSRAVAIRMNVATGMVTGMLYDPSLRRGRVSLQGAVLQKTKSAAGYILDPDSSYFSMQAP